jgi:hypothetical protein
MTIGILIDDNDRYNFFLRVLRSSFAKDIGEVFFFHSKYYSYARNLSDGNKHILLKAKTSESSGCIDCIEAHIYDRLPPSIDLDRASATAVQQVTELWIYSGFQFAAKIVGQYNKKKRFFEIGNFPATFQENNFGVNSDRQIEIGISDEDTVLKLRNELLDFIPPHVNKRIINRLLETTVNLISSRIFKTIAFRASFLDVIMRAYRINKARSLIRKYQKYYPKGDYNLFIAQVEHDSQTIYQSCETQLSALKKSIALTNSDGRRLVVRLHPGEKDYRPLKDIIKFCKLNNVEICNKGSLLQVVQEAYNVYTVNSTGGAHALLFGANVTCFGSAFYEGWTAKNVGFYATEILRKF